MTFEVLGFLSPVVDKFRGLVRSAPQSKTWLDFVEDLNRLGLDLMRTHEVKLADSKRLALSVLFIRGHQSFQAAVLLCERGMISDARTAVRGCVESAIGAAALSQDEAFIDRLIAAHNKHVLTLIRTELEDPDYRSMYSAEQIAALEARREEIRKDPRQPQKINWANVANAYNCKVLYHTLYRLLSSDAAHATVDALNRHVESPDGVNITALRAGPSSDGLVDTLKAASLAFLWLSLAAADDFDRADIRIRHQELLKRFQSLPSEEVAIVPIE